MKKLMTIMAGMVLLLTSVCGCGAKVDNSPEAATIVAESIETDSSEDSSEAVSIVEADEKGDMVRVGMLAGPTSLGMMGLIRNAESGITTQKYDFTIATNADELLPLIVKRDIDIALIPANVAGVLYNKTEGNIRVIDINTLGVLYMVSSDDSIKNPADLVGKTIYLTGKGTTPDYVLRYVLAENGISDTDVTLEYKSEATEVVSAISEDSDAVGLLPQPFVTVACAKNENLGIVMDMNEQWNKLNADSGSKLVTGVTITTADYLENHADAIEVFLTDHSHSVAALESDLDDIAALSVEKGILPNEDIALAAIPKCSITYITDGAMKDALDGYLSVLFEQDNASVGGALPGEDFYYVH